MQRGWRGRTPHHRRGVQHTGVAKLPRPCVEDAVGSWLLSVPQQQHTARSRGPMQLSHFLMQLHGPYYGVKCKTKMKQRVFKEKEKLTVFAPHRWRLCVAPQIQASQGRRTRSEPGCGIEVVRSSLQMQ
jgi:hypothetical protein